MNDKIADVLSKGDITGGHRSRKRAQDFLPDIRTELGLPDLADPALDPLLIQFLVEAVLGAAWYQKKYVYARRKVWFYILCNIVLVVGLPLALIELGQQFPKITQTSLIASQITGVLTGILALQKTLSAWYSQQQRYAAWFKAAADLKSLYYAFILTWSGKVPAQRSEFCTALTAATQASRKVISDEQLDYYQKLVLPSFDVLDMLTATRSTVSSFVTNLLPGMPPVTVSAVGKTAIAATQPADQPAAALPAILPSGPTSPQVTLLAPGAQKPNDNPYTIVFIANPVVQSPVGSQMYVVDPILSSRAGFDACVQYALDSIFGKLPGQRENFAAAFQSQIRVLAIFDPALGPQPQNALVEEYEGDIVSPRQDLITALLANYRYNGRQIKADIAFAVTDSITATRCSAQFTWDDDGAKGVAFQMDGRAFTHRFTNIYPGAVALHTSASSIVALHEFGHAASSWTNGGVNDLYYETTSMQNNPVNVRIGRPIPASFANYAGAAYQSDPSRDGIGYEPGWNSYACALVDADSPAVMDDFWRQNAQHPEYCRHDQITVKFLSDRIRAIMSRP